MVGMKQEFRQSQSLVMTQALQQSIKLLQLSAVELQEFIDTEIEKNPLLAREESDDDRSSASEDSADAGDLESTLPTAAEEKEVTLGDDDYAAGDALDDESYSGEWSSGDAEHLGRISAGTQGGAGGNFEDGEGPDIEGAAAHDKTLREHLMEQIRVDVSDPVQQLIAEKLVDMLDDAGYLREDTAALAESLGVSVADIEAVILQLQRMEPSGVCARNLTECLTLQLIDMNRFDPVMEILLENLEMIGRGELVGLRKKCGVDEEDFAQMLGDIRRCDPKPGIRFAREEAPVVTPDVLVRRARGGWAIELNPEALPRVLINRHYAAEVNARPSDKDTKKFLGEQMANANWLIKALDSRAQTILKVAQEIVKQQEMFLVHGIRFLKPLVLKDIAAAIGMHESTISRVTTAKYMSTPRGTLELKYFFTSSINSGSGQTDFSSKTVMYYIKELVDAEEPKKILSDDAIVTRLKDRNIEVARRTVTKYREEMNIPASPVRRRLKQGEK